MLALGIICAIGASALYNTSVALQALEAREVGHEHALRASLIGRLARNRRWLIATLKVNAATVDYVGSPRADERYATAALITYKLTREVWLKGEYRHEWRHSNVPGNDYQADVLLLGARLQR